LSMEIFAPLNGF